MRYEELFSHYGYLMLLVGSLGEGMPIMLFGGFAAHRGWLVLMPTVILAGALGNATAQGLWFFAARYAGEKILEKRADWARNVKHINGWVKRWEGLAVVGARFIPGMSSAAVIAIALSGISATRFCSSEHYRRTALGDVARHGWLLARAGGRCVIGRHREVRETSSHDPARRNSGLDCVDACTPDVANATGIGVNGPRVSTARNPRSDVDHANEPSAAPRATSLWPQNGWGASGYFPGVYWCGKARHSK